jgi:hypothetical protein
MTEIPMGNDVLPPMKAPPAAPPKPEKPTKCADCGKKFVKDETLWDFHIGGNQYVTVCTVCFEKRQVAPRSGSRGGEEEIEGQTAVLGLKSKSSAKKAPAKKKK